MKTRTFKNPDLEYNTDAWHSDSWGWQVEDEIFESGLWDMEITFIKKLKELTLGERVEVYPEGDYPHQGTVLWFDDTHALLNKGYGPPELVSRDIIGV